jgi:predicted dienelactone hydrolase
MSNAGLSTSSFVGSDRVRRSFFAWYPTDAKQAPHNYAVATIGNVAVDAAPLDGPLPLLIFSHGDNSFATQSVFITEQLARAGYVVVATNHDDSQVPPFATPEVWTVDSCFNRRDDVAALLDHAPTKFEISGPIGFVGHSLGGYTGLAMAGALPSWKDDRIQVVLAYSPYNRPLALLGSYENVVAPVMLQGGLLDTGITPTLPAVFEALKSTKYFVEFISANHLAWTNTTCLDSPDAEQCIVSEPLARLILEYSIPFLDATVRGVPSDIPADQQGVLKMETATAALGAAPTLVTP